MKLFLQKTVLYILLFLLLNTLTGYYLSTYEDIDLKEAGIFFPAMRWEEYYQLGKNIDILILGSSHANRGYAPGIIAQELPAGNQVFNFGSAAQSPVSSYFILNEILRAHKPKLVVMDIYPVVFNYDHQIRNGRFNWKPMKKGPGKRSFFLNGFSFQEQVALTLFPTYVYKGYLKPKIKKQLGVRYLPVNEGQYMGLGFATRRDSVDLEKLMYHNQYDQFEIDRGKVSKRNLHYLRAIAQKCQDANIPLVFMTTPLPQISVEKIPAYRDTYQFFKEIALEVDVPYVDFNITPLPDLKDDEHFFDDHHLNLAGAQLFSKAASSRINQLLQSNAQ